MKELIKRIKLVRTAIILSGFLILISSCHAQNSKNMDDRQIVKLTKDGKVKEVESLLKEGANVNATDNHNRPLLLLACINNDAAMVKMLVENNADVNQQGDDMDSPFLYTGAAGQTEFLKLFLKHGARFDVFNRYYGSALIPACERGHVETVRLLANVEGYPIDHVNRLGWTALMEAVILGDGSKKYQEVVKILKDAGAKLDIPDKDGITPLQHARARGYREIVKLLEQ
ncbi:MAG: ankyrin repeat domain-containing protein [Chitinophagaceae bacterium]|nr:ankyrin repeat domain-containing protein [Chitinophagaceae bacterium]